MILLKFKIFHLWDQSQIVICIYQQNRIPFINQNNLNIAFREKDHDENADINIVTTKLKSSCYKYLLSSHFCKLYERRHDIKNIAIKEKTKFCAYMYSYDLEYRVKFFKMFNNYKKVDALGKSCSNNIYTDRGTYNENETYNDIAVKKYSDYKFVLALENGIVKGYVTEKLLNPILAHSIPIYAGPIDAFNIINKERVIYVYDFLIMMI